MRRGARLCAAGLLAATLAVGGAASAIVTPAYADPSDALETQSNKVEINNATDFANAVENQAEGQVWNINADILITQDVMDVYKDVTGDKIEDYAGWYFPIVKNGITINGNGHTVSTNVEQANGNWQTQNLVTVAADDVTIDGLNFVCKEEVNKAIEVLGTGFTLKNSTLKPTSNGNSGSIYFGSGAGDATLDTVTISSWISTQHILDGGNSGSVKVNNVTVDMTSYSTEQWNPFYASNNIEVSSLTVKVNDDTQDLQEVVNSLPSNTTLSLASDINLDETLNIEDKTNFVLEGNNNTITASSQFKADEKGQINLVKPEDSKNMVIKDVTIETTSANKHALDVYGVEGLSLSNVTLDQSGSGEGGAPLVNNGSTITVDGPLTLITGANSWYAANVDNGGSLVVNDENGGTVSFQGDTAKGTVYTEQPSGTTIDLGNSGEQLANGVYGKAAAHIGEQGYLTLADAVEAAKSGDTIELAAGEHVGALDLTGKSLTIVGPTDGEAVIKFSRDTMLSETYNGTAAYPVVYSNKDLTLENVTIAGPTNQHHGIDGVYVEGGNLTMNNVTVRDIRCTADGHYVCGVQYGKGVIFDGHGDLSITNSSIVDFQKQAIDINTTGSVTIADNTITGIGDNQIIGQNGIVLRSGTATITGNRITDLVYSANNEWSHCSVGVYVFGDAEADLQGNYLENCDYALGVEDNAAVTAKKNTFLSPVYNTTDQPLDLSENYWGENPDFSKLVRADSDVTVYPRYADAAMTTLVDEQGEPVVATYDVTFVYGLGMDDKVEKVNEGETVAKPADPTYEGYKFVGWFATRNADNTVEDEYDFSTPVTEDLRLYAGWVKDGEADQTPTTPEAGTTTENDKADAGKSGLAQMSDPTTFLPAVVAAAAGVTTVAGAAVLRKRQR